jgi:trk system potassium uptake protein TrkA
MMRDLGVDEMVCPERIAAKEITNLLNNSAAAEFFDFSGGLLTMYMIRLEAGSPVVDHAVKDLVETYKGLQVKVVALLRGGETIIPHGDTVFHAGDMAYIIGRANQVETINRVAGKQAVNIKRVMIAGGGRIGRYAASTLQDRLKITLIEENRQRAEALSVELADTLVINGDATNIELLKEEGLQDADAFIGVTNSSETNVLTCLHAKRLGVKRTIALVDNTGFITISQDIGIDTIINRKLITASYIARFIVKGDALSSKWLSGTNAEVMEIVVGKWAPATRKPIGQLEIPHGATVGGIIRGRETMLPSREMQLKHGDKVVIFSLPSVMAAMVKLFD